jgi:hypothetical protein
MIDNHIIEFRGKPASKITGKDWIYGLYSEDSQGVPHIVTYGERISFYQKLADELTGFLSENGSKL